MKQGKSIRPRYNHLFEVLDGAAALHMAIRRAEEALLEPDIDERDRALLESVLEASLERQERITAILKNSNEAPEWSSDSDDGYDLSVKELLEAGRAADCGSEEAEIDALRALDRIARALDLEAQGCVESFLSHSSPLLRACAIKVLALHWRLPEYAERVLWALASDGEPECRRAAAFALASLYEGTRDRAIGKELVDIVTREDEEPDVRWASYYALLVVDGGGSGQCPLLVSDFDAPRDTDSTVLARYSSITDTATAR
jgi:hypothetical protein